MVHCSICTFERWHLLLLLLLHLFCYPPSTCPQIPPFGLLPVLYMSPCYLHQLGSPTPLGWINLGKVSTSLCAGLPYLFSGANVCGMFATPLSWTCIGPNAVLDLHPLFSNLVFHLLVHCVPFSGLLILHLSSCVVNLAALYICWFISSKVLVTISASAVFISFNTRAICFFVTVFNCVCLILIFRVFKISCCFSVK